MLNLNNEYLVINGRDSREFGIYLIDGNIFDYSVRDYQTYQIPGRTGDVSIDHGRWKNITVTFKCAAYDNSRQKLDAWRAFLLSGMGAKRELMHASTPSGIIYPGYNGSYRIETSIEPDVYRIGILKGASSPQLSLQGGGGYVEVSFDCSPKKYLKSGDEKLLHGNTPLYNPTYYDARPLIKVKALSSSGYIQIKNYAKDFYDPDHPYVFSQSEIRFMEGGHTFYIDCETRDASIEGVNYNNEIRLFGDDFPVIAAKSAIPETEIYTIILVGGLDIYEFYPRWWTL